MRILLLLFLSFALIASTSCGWRLRGTMTLPEGLDSVYVRNESESPVLTLTMEDLLNANQVNVVTGPGAAQMVVSVLSFREDRRVVSIGDNTLVTEYELIAEAEFSVEDSQGDPLLSPNTVSVIRAYQFDQDNILGKEEEERLIQEEMRRELAQQIIRRLRFLELQPNRRP